MHSWQDVSILIPKDGFKPIGTQCDGFGKKIPRHEASCAS